MLNGRLSNVSAFERPALGVGARAGHTLIEALLATVILSVVVFGAIAFMQAGAVMVDKAMLLRVTTQVAQDRLEQTKALPYANIVSVSSTTSTAVTIGGQVYNWQIIVTGGTEAGGPYADTTVSSGNTGHTRSYYKIIESRATCAGTGQMVAVRCAVSP